MSVERSDDIVYVNVLGGAEPDGLTVSSPELGQFVVTQAAGLPLTASGPGCNFVAPGRADCTTPAAGALLVGGAGNDRLAVFRTHELGAWLFGGDGDDELAAKARRRPARRRRGRRRPARRRRPPGRARLRHRRRPLRRRRRRHRRGRLRAAAGVPGARRPGSRPGGPARGSAPRTAAGRAGARHARRRLGHAPSPCRPAARDLRGRRALPRLDHRPPAPTCPYGDHGRPLAAPGDLRRRYSVGAGRTKTIKAHISRRGRQRVLQRRRARCSVRISSVGADGTKQTTTTRITIKAGGSR